MRTTAEVLAQKWLELDAQIRGLASQRDEIAGEIAPFLRLEGPVALRDGRQLELLRESAKDSLTRAFLVAQLGEVEAGKLWELLPIKVRERMRVTDPKLAHN